MSTSWEITLEQKNKPALHKPILIEGLPGIGNVGKIAVDFLIEELNAKKLCSFFSYKFPNSVFVGDDNLIESPKIELYYKKFASGSKKRDILLLTGDIQPIDEEGCYTFCEEILTIAKEFGVTQIIATGGIGLQSVPDIPRVYVTSNDASLFKSYTQKKLKVQSDIFGIVGPIIGTSGVLLGLGKRYKIPAVALLAETFAHPMYLGVKGGKELLRVIVQKHNLGINLKKMSKEVVEVEAQLMKKTKEWAAEMLNHSAPGAKVMKKEVSYIG